MRCLAKTKLKHRCRKRIHNRFRAHSGNRLSRRDGFSLTKELAGGLLTGQKRVLHLPPKRELAQKQSHKNSRKVSRRFWFLVHFQFPWLTKIRMATVDHETPNQLIYLAKSQFPRPFTEQHSRSRTSSSGLYALRFAILAGTYATGWPCCARR